MKICISSSAQGIAFVATLSVLLKRSTAQSTRERKVSQGQFEQSIQRALGYYDESCCEVICPELPPPPPYYEQPPHYPYKEKSDKEKNYKEKNYKEKNYKEKGSKKEKGYYRRLQGKGYTGGYPPQGGYPSPVYGGYGGYGAFGYGGYNPYYYNPYPYNGCYQDCSACEGG